MKKGTYLDDVRKQYENYPYPARVPEHEKGVLFSSKSSSLDNINYFCFEGKRDFSKPFRVLVAGGGTGDCCIYLAEQLRDTPAEIIYLDMSKASMDVAKKRAKIRKLTNITWVHDSLLNLPNTKLGKFDFITCTGVLHHLEDPKAGLDALKSVLHEEGSIFLMLYAEYGRTAIYQMQDLLRRIHANEPDYQKRIDRTRALLKTLPEGNWFNFNAGAYRMELQSDIGVYDLLLHTQDRAYTVPQLFDYVEEAGLVLNKLLNLDHPLGDMVFQPETFIKDPAMLEGIKQQSFKEQAAIGELMFGQLMKQCCYISFKDKPQPRHDDLNLIPSIAVASTYEARYEELKAAFVGNSPKIQVNPQISFNRSKFAAEIFKAIDGKTSSQDIIDQVHANSGKGIDKNIVENHYKSIIEILLKVSIVSLRSESAKPYRTIPEMQSRMYDLYGEKLCRKIFETFLSKMPV